VAASRLAPEIMIERHDAEDVGARQIELSRHQGGGRFGNVAEGCLQGVQDGQCRPIQLLHFSYDFPRAGLVPRSVRVAVSTTPGPNVHRGHPPRFSVAMLEEDGDPIKGVRTMLRSQMLIKQACRDLGSR
jgi:hypothetical protein